MTGPIFPRVHLPHVLSHSFNHTLQVPLTTAQWRGRWSVYRPTMNQAETSFLLASDIRPSPALPCIMSSASLEDPKTLSSCHQGNLPVSPHPNAPVFSEDREEIPPTPAIPLSFSQLPKVELHHGPYSTIPLPKNLFLIPVLICKCSYLLCVRPEAARAMCVE